MATKCQIVETLKYIEDLYRQIPSTKENKARRAAIENLFTKFNRDRARIQQAAGYLGAELAPSPAPTEQFSYTAFAKRFIEFIKSTRPIDVVKDKDLAWQILTKEKDSKVAVAWHEYLKTGHQITYPDYEALLNDKTALKKLQTTLNLASIDEARSLIEAKQKSLFLAITKVHEHIHAGATRFMQMFPYDEKTKYVHSLFEKTLKLAETDTDLDSIQDGYWKTDVDEFIAVALSNPKLMQKLNEQEATGFVSQLHKLVHTLAKMVKINMGSESEALFNIFLQMAEDPLEYDTPPWVVDDAVPFGDEPWAPDSDSSVPFEPDIPVEDTTQAEPEIVTEEVVQPETETGPAPEPYKINDKMSTNVGQTRAINKIKEWYTTNKQTFLLQGRGGTGKTTVINVLLQELGLNPTNVTFAAPTNKAIKVLQKANLNSPYGASPHYTVAQLLGVKPEYDREGNQIFLPDPYATLPPLGKILVIDEASMLHSENYNEIMANAAASGTKIIFMGDNAQLPPIKDKHAPIKSIVFTENKDTNAKLTELMRQGEKSPIITLTDRLIAWVDEIEKKFTNKTSSKLKEDFQKELWDGAKFTKFDAQTNEGVILASEDFSTLLPSFLQDYKLAPQTTKYINYNAFDHPTTLANIEKIRHALYGDEALTTKFLPGEPLMANGPYEYDLDLDESKRVTNGEEFVVVSSQIVEKVLDYKVGQRLETTRKTIKVYEITGKSTIDGETIIFNKPLDKKSVNALMADERKRLHEKGQNPNGAFRLTNVLASQLAHGYIINSHRSQGSTYDTVYMDLGNIAGQGKADVNSIVKSLYVAASRPRKKLVVIDNRPLRGNKLINAQPIRQVEDTPKVKTQNKGEQADVLENVDKCAAKGQ